MGLRIFVQTMYRQSATPAVRALLRADASSPSAYLNGLQRFSTTARNDVRALFGETENPELKKVFDVIQDKIIFPSYLPAKQRGIVFSPLKRNYLEQNPIVIEVEGVEHKFKTIDRHKDIPKSHKLLREALGAMKTPSDWENLPTLLAGFHKAGTKLNSRSYGERVSRSSGITRLACQQGQVQPIIESAKQASETGFYIATKEQLCYIMEAICKKVDEAEGDLEALSSAVKMVDLVLEIVQRPDHVKFVDAKTPRDQLQFSLMARAYALNARARLFKARKDAGESAEADLVHLTDEIKLLSSLWSAHAEQAVSEIPEIRAIFPRTNIPTEFTKKCTGADNNTERVRCLGRANYVMTLARHIQSIELVQKLANEYPEDFSDISTALEKQLLPASRKLDAHLKEFSQDANAQPTEFSMASYQTLLGRQFA